VGRTEEAAERAVREIGGGVPAVTDFVSPSGEVLVLAVSDDALPAVSRAIAERVAGRTAVRLAFHLSGALPAAAIGALRSPATAVGSFHPLRAMTGAAGETLAGAFVAIEGDPEACAAGLRFAAVLGADGHRIAADAKSLYHAGATLAAGGTVALISLAARAWSAAGLPEEQSRTALAGLAGNAAAGAAARPFDDALTGAVARRDLGTVRAHRDALAPFPELLRLYALLAAETLARTPGRGREDEIRALLAC
jgi:predicted short-subunit dehydrogenase-like oxidoreductase (DUF2520 family)